MHHLIVSPPDIVRTIGDVYGGCVASLPTNFDAIAIPLVEPLLLVY